MDPGSEEVLRPYRREGDAWLVELRLETLEQLFYTLDPSPFWKRDLDPAAVDYIRDSVDELPRQASIRIVIYAGVADPVAAQEIAGRTIHDFFLYRARISRQRLQRLLRRGRASLVVGLGFLSLCLLISGLLAPWQGLPRTLLHEGVLILGWVAMWRPLEIFLYDWWPHLGRARLHERIAGLPVEVRPLPRPPLKNPGDDSTSTGS